MTQIPSDDQILQVLDELESHKADELESEVLDFKSWDNNMKRNLEKCLDCAVPFANANGGAIVFGVKDGVVGRTEAIAGCSECDLDRFREYVCANTTRNLQCEVHTLVVPEGTLTVIRVPPCGPPPCGTRAGVFTTRVGKSNLPVDPAALGGPGESPPPQAPLSEDEGMLLRFAAKQNGDIYLPETLEDGTQVMGAEHLWPTKEARARCLDALQGLLARGYMRRTGGKRCSLTGTGWGTARRFGATDRQTEELIRKQVALRFGAERDRLEHEGRQNLSAVMVDLKDGRIGDSIFAQNAVVRTVLRTLEGIARARIAAELVVLREANLRLDRQTADALAAEVRSVIDTLARGMPQTWVPPALRFPDLGRCIAKGASPIAVACLRDIELELNSALLGSKWQGTTD